MQITLVYFLFMSTINGGKDAGKNEDNNEIKFELPTDVNLVIGRVICTVFLHISLNGEL